MGDFMGTKNISNINKKFISYKKAKAFVKKLKLKNQKGWNKYSKSGKLPSNIPSDPQSGYKNKGWKSLGDFLGTGVISYKLRKIRSFKSARAFARKLKIKNVSMWAKYYKSGKIPPDIPKSASRVYKNKGWKGWTDFLGTGYRIYCSYQKAKAFAKSSGIKSSQEWKKYFKLGKISAHIPSTPSKIYKGNGWKGWGDFLGTGNLDPKNRKYFSYNKARSFVRRLKLNGHTEWMKFKKSIKRPQYIPGHPKYIYKNKGWKGWKDFLGTG